MTTEQTLRELASAGVCRFDAAKRLGLSWYTFRQVIRDYPDIQWQSGRGSTIALARDKLIARSRQRVADLEAEYGVPIAQIVADYAADGESKAATAAILGIPWSTFRHWACVNDPAIKWPSPHECNAWRAALTESPNRASPAVQAAARRNLAKARAVLRQA